MNRESRNRAIALLGGYAAHSVQHRLDDLVTGNLCYLPEKRAREARKACKARGHVLVRWAGRYVCASCKGSFSRMKPTDLDGRKLRYSFDGHESRKPWLRDVWTPLAEAAPSGEPGPCRGPCCRRCTPDYPLMLACPTCGNKRCPRALDHDLCCTGSNEPGQVVPDLTRPEPL